MLYYGFQNYGFAKLKNGVVILQARQHVLRGPLFRTWDDPSFFGLFSEILRLLMFIFKAA